MDLSSPFPADIGFSCIDSQLIHTVSIHPEEEAILSPRATENRRSDFRLGRIAARQALEQIGISPAPPVLRGEQRAPLFPPNTVGSITHSHGWAVAIAASSKRYDGVGIDLERVTKRRDLSHKLCSESERQWILEDEHKVDLRMTMLFSAKESLFKAIYPLYLDYFWFDAVELSWQAEKQAFAAHLLFDAHERYPQGTRLQVFCQTLESAVFTYLVLERS